MKRGKRLASICSKLVSDLIRDESGNYAMIFGFAFLPLLVAVGVGVDMTQQTRLEQKMAGAADAIALAAARVHKDVANRDDVGPLFLDANLASDYGPNVQVTTLNVSFNDTDKLVTVNLVAQIPTSILGIVGIDTLVTNTTSTVSYKSQVSEPVSLAMVLDVSGSMCWNNKIGTLRTAASNLLTQLDEADPDDVYVRTGLVTYSSAIQQTVNMGWGVNQTNPVVQSLPCNGGTASTGAVTSAGNWLIGNGEYTIHQSQPIHTGEEFILHRFMIFMTDGDNNYNSDDTATKAKCDQIKADGIEIFAVAFEAPAGGQALLQYCATDADHYYDASDSEEFLLAFDEIAESIETALVRIID